MGCPDSLLLTEYILIEIFQSEHQARGKGNSKRSGGDALLLLLRRQQGLAQGWQGCQGA